MFLFVLVINNCQTAPVIFGTTSLPRRFFFIVLICSFLVLFKDEVYDCTHLYCRSSTVLPERVKLLCRDDFTDEAKAKNHRSQEPPLCHTAPESSMMRTSSNNGEHGLSTCLSGVHLTCERRKRRRPLVHVCSSSPPVKNAKRTTRKGQGRIAAMHHMNNTLLVAVRNFATAFVFPKAKFIQTELTAKQYCMLAVANNDVALPSSATAEQFAEIYHESLKKRVRHIRLNSNTRARAKYIADLKEDKVPKGFSYKTLIDGYRDYIVEDNDSEEKKKKKKAGLVGFHYFVDRILASVNADRTRFGPEKHKKQRVSLLLSNAFTISDEAYALFMLENYETRWRLQYEHPNDKNRWRQDKDFQAKFTSSNNGLNHKTSISNAIKSFNEKCAFVAKKRSDDTKGCVLEKKLQEGYKQGSGGEAMKADMLPGGISKQQQGGDNGD
eukprot:scaffold237_cov201-Cylindrotheca_fusiformis.AAC.1